MVSFWFYKITAKLHVILYMTIVLEPGESFLWINKKMGLPINVTAMQPSAQWNIEVRGHPHPTIKWYFYTHFKISYYL